MCIYLKNNRAKFHPDPIWNDGALGFYEECHPNKKHTDQYGTWDQFVIQK